MSRYTDRPVSVAVGLPLHNVRGVWREQVLLTATGTQHTIQTTDVPSGEVWVATSITAYDATSAPSSIICSVYDGSLYYAISTVNSPGVNEGPDWSGFIVLDDGERITATFIGVTVGDTLALMVVGYKLET